MKTHLPEPTKGEPVKTLRPVGEILRSAGWEWERALDEDAYILRTLVGVKLHRIELYKRQVSRDDRNIAIEALEKIKETLNAGIEHTIAELKGE